jgi:uncharacterized lipoprotein YddW (UPF0748 family)
VRVSWSLTRTFSFLALFLAVICRSSTEAAPGGSVWIVRDLLLSKEGVDRAISDMKDTGLTRAFIQVSGKLHSYFPSDVLPTAEELIDRGELADPFVYFVRKAKESGIEVHAWVNVLYAWSSGVAPRAGDHPFNMHPQWFVHDGMGLSMRYTPMADLRARDIPGYFVSPAHPDVVDLVTRYLEEIARSYDVDGIHLDYIRYPTRDTGFGPLERAFFERSYYVDPLELFDSGISWSLEQRFGEKGMRDLREKWVQCRAGFVTNLVRAARERLLPVRADLELSAAVFPDPEVSKEIYAQDWAGWLDQGLVDFVITMNYTKSTRTFRKNIENPLVRAHAGQVVVGVSTFNQGSREAAGQARLAIEQGMRGVCFFSYNDLSTKEGSLQDIKQFLRSTN